MRSAPGAGARPARLRDIQALHALAVLLVVVDHFRPSRLLPGGYVGVHMLSVISGHLIAGPLLRELRSTGTLDLKAFLGRRPHRR